MKDYSLAVVIIAVLFSTLFFTIIESSGSYLVYGNYCGLGGSGEPVDEFDAYCMEHDACYGENDIDTGIVFVVKQFLGFNNDPSQIECDKVFCKNINSLQILNDDQRRLLIFLNEYFNC